MGGKRAKTNIKPNVQGLVGRALFLHPLLYIRLSNHTFVRVGSILE